MTASGTGFSAFEAVDLYFDTEDLCLGVTNGTGAFSSTLKVPSAALPGTHWITAVGRKSGSAAQKWFIVRTNWTQFRYGPKHQGYNPYENLLSTSNVAGLNQAWRYDTGDDIRSSPAVAYFGSLDGKLYALNASTGALKWTATTGGDIFTSPAVAGGVVYVGSNDRSLYAYSLSPDAVFGILVARPDPARLAPNRSLRPQVR